MVRDQHKSQYMSLYIIALPRVYAMPILELPPIHFLPLPRTESALQLLQCPPLLPIPILFSAYEFSALLYMILTPTILVLNSPMLPPPFGSLTRNRMFKGFFFHEKQDYLYCVNYRVSVCLSRK